MAVLLTLVALFLLIDGIIDLVSAVVHRDAGWGWLLASGIIGILAALFLLANPLLGAFSMLLFGYYVLGFAAIFKGIMRMLSGKRTADMVGYQWSWSNFFLGVLELIIGIFLLARPLLGMFSLFLLLAMIAIVGGIVTIIQSFRVKNLMSKVA
jgi:uncharacterized membrane protein HdeD (DUF308 family)